MKNFVATCFLFSFFVFVLGCDKKVEESHEGGLVVAPAADLKPSCVTIVVDGTSQEVCDGEFQSTGCMSEADCADNDPCTTDSCVNGDCINVDVEIDDGNPCTEDTCNLIGEIYHIEKACNDSNPSTVDQCNPETGGCEFLNLCFGGCHDDDPCTTDSCDAIVGCVHAVVDCGDNSFICVGGTCQFWCGYDEECDDGIACTLDICNQFGFCEYEIQPCNDDNPSTVDVCVDGSLGNFTCEHYPTTCLVECDDNNPCTDDDCIGTACVYQPTNVCGQGTECDPEKGCIPAPCSADDECDDNNPCTDDDCDNGLCKGEPAVVCSSGQICNLADGECVELSPCPQGCEADEVCHAGECLPKKSKPAVSCGPGTELDPKTGQCLPAQADVLCVDGTVACKFFEVPQVFAYAVCISNAWIILENCGNNACKPGFGCVVDEPPPVPKGQCGGKPNGTPCNDGNACTTFDTCANGTCVGISALECDDGNELTVDTCNPATGCVNTPKPPGWSVKIKVSAPSDAEIHVFHNDPAKPEGGDSYGFAPYEVVLTQEQACISGIEIAARTPSGNWPWWGCSEGTPSLKSLIVAIADIVKQGVLVKHPWACNGGGEGNLAFTPKQLGCP